MFISCLINNYFVFLHGCHENHPTILICANALVYSYGSRVRVLLLCYCVCVCVWRVGLWVCVLAFHVFGGCGFINLVACGSIWQHLVAFYIFKITF